MGIIQDRIRTFSKEIFISCQGKKRTYQKISEGIAAWLDHFPGMNIHPGDVVSVVGRFSPGSIALLLALLENRNIVVPLDDETQEDIEKRHGIAQVTHHFQRTSDDEFKHRMLKTADASSHPLLSTLRNSGDAGVILFTSGSTGESKAALHNFNNLIRKFISRESGSDQPRKPLNTMVFLKFDHIGGLNTMFSVLMNGGRITTVEDRSPNAVCRLIEAEKVELLPTTPSFLNMLILANARASYDLSSLKLISYGTEAMPESTLRSMAKLFPHVKLKQTYGLTELGIFPTRSRSNESTFMEIREETIQTKIKDNILYIKSDSAMLGYLNADSPFDEDGWYNTGDKVIIEDGYTRILGRDSEIINVGGEKVFPAEIESILLEMDNVKDVTVTGKSSPIIGQIVMAMFNLECKEELADLRKRVWDYCQGRMETYKIPRHIVISDYELISNRLKKNRRSSTQQLAEV